MNVIRLFRTIILRHLRLEWGKLALSVAGVAIGVAVFVAIRLANGTAFQAFTNSLDVVSGRANLQAVSGNGVGFDERYIARLRASRAVEAAAPVIEQYAVVDDGSVTDSTDATPLLVFGIDVFSEGKFRSYASQGKETGGGDQDLRFLLEKNAIIITEKLARQYHHAKGDSIALVANGKRLMFHVVDIIRPEGTASALGGNFALLDIGAAQEAFDRVGKLDRIDMIVPAKDREEIKEYLAPDAPKGVEVREPESRNAQATKMLDSFDLNLTALGFIALFVSMFIIYNTMLTNTLRRRRELGILRSLGATRGLILRLFLSEAVVIGILGALVGLPLGIALSRVALEQVTRTVSALYILTVVDHLRIDPFTLLVGGLLGVAASTLSALPAAIEASRAHPRETFSVQSLETKVRLNLRRIFLGTALALAGTVAACWLGIRLVNPLLGFAGAGLLLIGVALLTPAFITGASRLSGKLIKRLFGIEGELANAYLQASLGRASTAVAALMTAIAMLIGISTMVDSFRKTVDYWMRQTITADLYMTVPFGSVPGELVRYLDSLPELRNVDALRRIRQGYQGRTVAVSGARFNLPAKEASLEFKDEAWDVVMAALDTGAIAVSEGFGLKFHKGRGDTIVLATPTGNHPLTIAGTYYDYSSDAGSVMMRSGPFVRTFGDTTVNNVALYLRDSSKIEEVRAKIERHFAGRYQIIVYSNLTLRNQALAVFDQTFAITYALQFVAIVVAAIGVANTLAAMVVERSREIGILKAVGATAAQLRKMTLVQAGLIGVASQTLGVVAGLGLSAILIYVINRVSFGWTIQLTISPGIIIVSGVLVMVTAFLAGLAPANAAAKKQVAQIVRNE
ncbi:MAG: FtsX-like permease family protein [Candidatus Kapaibacterium sp.]